MENAAGPVSATTCELRQDHDRHSRCLLACPGTRSRSHRSHRQAPGTGLEELISVPQCGQVPLREYSNLIVWVTNARQNRGL